MAHDAVRGQMAAPDLGRSRSTQHTTTIAAEAVTAARPAQRRRTNPSRPAAAGATAPASSSRQRAGCLEEEAGAVFAICLMRHSHGPFGTGSVRADTGSVRAVC